MRLQHFAVGDRFEFEGAIWIKTGPMTACAEQGGQRMIPRHAELKPLVEAPAPAAAVSGTSAPDRGAVIAAFNHFCSRIRPMLDPEQAAVFDTASDEFRRRLG